MIQNIYSAVTHFASAITFAVLGETSRVPESVFQQIFISTMAHTNINLVNDYWAATGKRGNNSEIDKQGNYLITLGALSLISNPDKLGQTGINLVAHEFGHNLTYQNRHFAEAADYSDSMFFGVDASSIHGDADEESADAFASWALNAFNAPAINTARARGERLNNQLLTVDVLSAAIGCAALPNANGCGR